MADRRRTTRQPNAIVSSAAVLDLAKLDRIPNVEKWQDEAWEFYDETGEVRFALSWLSNAMSRCRLVAARAGRSGDEPSVLIEPDPDGLEDADERPSLSQAESAAVEILESLAGGTQGQSQILSDCTVPLSVSGDGYIVGEPSGSEDGATAAPDTWQVLSRDELSIQRKGSTKRYGVKVGDQQNDIRVLAADALAVHVWRPHKRWHYKPDSPMRACLPALRQIRLLSRRIDAEGLSRIAGAGLLVLPKEIEFAVPERFKDHPDPFSAVLHEAMTTPIKDPNSPSVVMPVVLRIKGDLIEKIQHIKFSTPFDERVLELLEMAIRRFAAGIDLPAEIVLGLADANHWTAWQIEESALKLHVEPMLEAICHGLTVGYLQPALKALGVDDPDLIVWYDTSELEVRPDKSEHAEQAVDKQAISLAAYRKYLGFTEDDAPSDEELKRLIILKVIDGAPTLAPLLLKALGIDLGLPDVLPAPEQNGNGEDGAPGGGEDATPPTRDDAPPAPDENAAAAAAIVAAADVLVSRALERAGNRMQNAARSAGITVDTGIGADLIHTVMPDQFRAESLANGLLDGAWLRVPEIASRYRVEPLALQETLDVYVRGLIASGFPHEFDKLAAVLGA